MVDQAVLEALLKPKHPILEHLLRDLRRGFAILLTILGLLLAAAPAQAQTTVSGAITSATRWTTEGNPYVLSGAVTVQNGATLTVDPGVVIYMASGTSLNIVSGKLLLQGEAGKPVTITSDKVRQGMTPAAGDWGKLTFAPGATDSALNHADIAYGSGLSIEGASVALNHVRIQGHAVAAINADLAARLTGSGNQASGNQTNAVVIPSGDIISSARLGLRGIPYLVRDGVLSVGASPTIDTVEPSGILAGETLTLAITGKRLSGATQPRWSMAGLETQLLAGATDTQLQLQVTAPLNAVPGSADLSLLTDAGTVTRPGALSILRNQPHIANIEPSSVFTYAGSTTLTVNGIFISSQSIVELDGQSLPTTVMSETQITAVLPEQTQAGNRTVRLKTPDDLNAGSYLSSNTATLVVVQAQGSFEPSTASTFAGASQTMKLTIPFDAPAGGLNFTLTSASPAIAKVDATVTIPAGSRSGEFQVYGVAVGNTSITAARAGWASASLAVAVIEPPVSLAYDPVISHLVGVDVGEPPPAMAASYNGLTSPLVGLSVGSHARQLTPTAGVVGTSFTLQVSGEGLNAVSSVQFVPPDGVTLGVPTASLDGKSLTVSVDIDASAVKSTRQVVLNTAAGTVPFTTATGDRFVVAAPIPVLESISPNVLVAGQPATSLYIRGQNLRDVQAVRFVPAQGFTAISSPITNADGTQMEINVVVDAAATPGARTVVVTTAGGESSASPVPGNTLQISREAGQTFAAINSPLVGVAVGDAPHQVQQDMGPYISAPVGVLVGEAAGGSGTESSPFGPVASPMVGLVTGAGAVDMTPTSASTGASVPVMVKGAGLEGVTQVQIVPADGVQVSGISAHGDGTQVSFTISIDANAPETLRKVVLLAADKPVPFLNEAKSRFLVAGEVPVLDGSITPQVVVAGGPRADLTIRGRNLGNVIGVSLLPPEGMSVLGIPTASADGSTLSVSVEAAASAAMGPRVVVVSTVAGQSSEVATAANTIQVVREITGTMGDLNSPLVGVRVGDGPAEQSVERSTYAPNVGMAVGPYVATIGPAGVAKGFSGSLTIAGAGLQAAASVVALPSGAANGVSLGVPSANPAGTELVVPYEISASAPSAGYRISVLDGQGQPLPSLTGAAVQWRILDVPTISSCAPIVMNPGRAYSLEVRGNNLKEVQSIRIEPATGITTEDVAMTWSSDTSGEKLTLRLILAPEAATGPRIVRLVYPGGITDGQPTSSNTLNVTAP